MVETAPLCGYRYAPGVTRDIGKLIAPPYDVINGSLRDTLFRLSEYNIARITRAERQESAARLWTEWRKSGILRRDEKPAIYVCEQFFEMHGNMLSRTGMVVLVRLEPLGEGVLPHENTLARPRADRLELMRATRAQFGQVFGLYSDPDRRVDDIMKEAKARRPLIQAVDWEKHLHRLWAITDQDALGRIHDAMLDKQIIIADGHHRYETSLIYREEHPECEAAKFRMMTLVNMSNVGLVILPSHRLATGLVGFAPREFLARLRKAFEIRTYPGDSAAVRNAVIDAVRAHQAAGRHAFGLYMGNGNHHVLVLRSEEMMRRMQGRSDAWHRLDVTILHHLILEQTLGVTKEQTHAESNIEYVQDFPHAVEEASGRVRSGECQALLLLNPTRVEEVQAVARNRERMPQKSTFFYPKVYSGLVIHSME